MIVLFTDFGFEGPYLGQMKAVIAARAPAMPVIDLFADAPAFSPKASSYLLSAYMDFFPPETIFLCVVDPGVGSDRIPLVVRAFDKWFVGPDNGLFEHILRRADRAKVWEIEIVSDSVSASFHGRDVFAPVAVELSLGVDISSISRIASTQLARKDWPDDLAEIVYIDVYGNCITGIRASQFHKPAVYIRGIRVPQVKTFSDVPAGFPLIYANANGLMEVAVNSARADEQLKLSIGAGVNITVD